MRTFKTILFVGLVTSTGCKWTDFDDLESETWVSSTTKPNKASTDFGVALGRGARTSASGGKLDVIATGKAQLLELSYAANGDSDVSATVVLGDVAPVQDLDVQPIMLADPASDEIALVAARSSGGVSVLHGAGQLADHAIPGPSQVDAAAYVTPPGAATGAAPLVGAVDTVYGSFYGNPTPTSCVLQDSAGSAIELHGLGGARISSATEDDIVVWGSVGNNGQLLVYPSSVFGGCATPTVATVSVPTTFKPELGSQIIMVDATHALLVGHQEVNAAESYLALYDVSATPPALVGTAVTQPGLRTATLLALGAQTYVVAGYPTDTVDGVGNAGRVLVYPLSLATGVGATPAMELHDAQPEDDQAFGRAVAVTEFNGKPVIAVGADNEVFFYFRTTLYDETRQ